MDIHQYGCSMLRGRREETGRSYYQGRYCEWSQDSSMDSSQVFFFVFFRLVELREVGITGSTEIDGEAS
jgi:hypothetical protein